MEILPGFFVENPVNSDVHPIVMLKYSLMAGIGLYAVFMPFCVSRKSWCDAISARAILKFLRTAIFFETICNLMLLYFVIDAGSPLSLYEITSYGKGQGSWVYGYGRPMFGLIMIGVGSVGDMHPLPRYCCFFGALIGVIGDALSAYQVGNYIQSISDQNAPLTGKYTETSMEVYFWRDIVSFGLGVWISLLIVHCICVIGLWQPPFISFQSIMGGDFDRCEVMRSQRSMKHNVSLDTNLEEIGEEGYNSDGDKNDDV